MMVPKAYAALSDALDEGLGFALNRVLEAERGKDESDEAFRERVKEEMRHEVLNAICERFTFTDVEGE